MSDKKICFVLIGFGVKPDYRTGRQLDLDKTFEFLIKPVFDDLDITCVRACDIPHSGVIDVPMYENILKADIVVADLSTLNANAIYELGIRHALRPQTTIVIAEKELAYPFDLNHIIITSYEHLGKDVGAAEARRFYKELKELVDAVLANPQVDSPVYTYLQGLNPPEFTKKEIKEIEAAVKQDDSTTNLLKEAERLKGEKKYLEGIEKLKEAQQRDMNNPLFIQKIALLTYKSGDPNKITALKNSLEILKPLKPEITNDPETLGLSGAIYKRLFEETKLDVYLDKAKSFYERGFIVSKDYYNGINLAYLLLLTASLAKKEEDKIADVINARRVRKRTQDICLKFTEQENFLEMPDRVWILLTLAEIAFVDGNQTESDNHVNSAIAEGATPFEIDSFEEQKNKLKSILETIQAT
jgi:ADP-ribose pyrophosphatase YjhB (NUDIX family)